jgi:hypothetical protein
MELLKYAKSVKSFVSNNSIIAFLKHIQCLVMIHTNTVHYNQSTTALLGLKKYFVFTLPCSIVSPAMYDSAARVPTRLKK